MVLRGVFIAFLLAALDIAVCAPAEKENIDPVKLSYYCYRLTRHDINKSPILLIHGLCSSKADWNGLYETLAFETERQVCMVDLRNHGDSPWNDHFDVEAMTVDIEHFLEERNIQKVNLIGHSLGGKISVHYALKNPDRVDSLVVEDIRPNTYTRKSIEMVQGFVKVLQDAIKSVPDESNEDTAKKAIINFFMEKLAGFGFNDSTAENLEHLLAIRFVDGKWQYKMNLDLIVKKTENPEEFLTPSYGLYNGPAMFIYGTESEFDVGGDESNIRELFPNTTMVPVKGAGHIIHGLFRQFEDEVIKFLNKIN